MYDAGDLYDAREYFGLDPDCSDEEVGVVPWWEWREGKRPPGWTKDDECGMPVALLDDGRLVAFDESSPEGRPFPRKEYSSLTRISRERFDKLRALNASQASV